MKLRPGQMLLCYRLVEEVGAGGMGVVWKAVDTRLDREVALKVLPEEMASSADRLQRFEREAKTVAALNHPNIVTLHSVEEADGIRFITMELIQGRTLADCIPRSGLPLNRYLEIAIPLADALRAAHDRGVVHRDLKPTNIMITDDGRPKILDFGLAKPGALASVSEETLDDAVTMSAMTSPGQVIGTMPYMSPEQLQGAPVDHRADLFSLGVILHEMATGKRPFRGSSSAELISAILRDAPAPISEVNADFPYPADRIVARCLEKDLEARYLSAAEIRADLEELQAQAASGQLSGKPARRRRVVRPAVLVLVLVAASVLSGLGFMLFRPRTPAEETGAGAVAILPFVNLTGDPDQDYLSQGISAGLITRLGEVSGVRVVGRTATWVEGAGAEAPRELAKRLGVSVLLEGEVQQAAELLRVEVKLTDAGSGVVLWSEGFRGRGEDVFTLQAEIAHQLATVLSISLSRDELRRLAKNPTTSLKAYEYFLQGHQRLRDYSDPRSVDSAIEMLRQSIRLDASFALAHVGLSEALWRSYLRDKEPERLAEAEREARKALEIDPELPTALVALARIHRTTGQYAESIDELRGVLADHPKPEEAQLELADSYQQVGDLEEAERCLRAAIALGEQDWFSWNRLGAFLEQMGRYEEAREAFEKASARAPARIGVPHENLAALSIQQGRFDEAIEAYERIPGPVRDPALASNIGTAYYFSERSDKWEQAEQHYKLAVLLSPRNATIRRNLADLYLELGRRDEALEHYREAQRIVEQLLQADPENHGLRLLRALYAAKADDCSLAVPMTLELATELPRSAQNFHRLASVYAICGRTTEALDAIRDAIDLGFSAEIIRQEGEFRGLREDPEFVELTATD